MTKKYYFNDLLKDTPSYKVGKTFEDLISEFGLQRDQILRLAGNESTIGTSLKAINAAQKACQDSNFYAQPKSDDLISALEENFALEVDMTNLAIVAGNGMDSIIEHCLTLFAKSGDSILEIKPTFIYYAFAAKRLGLEVIEVARQQMELQDKTLSYKVNLEDIFSAIKDNTKIIFLCSPNNPDGSVMSLSEISKLAQFCMERGIVLFVDHAYIEFTDRKTFDARSIIHDFPNMIIGYTFSKAYALAGFRVGYALMHQEIQVKFLSLLTPFLIAKPSIAAAITALEDKDHLAKILDNNKSQKLWLEFELKNLGFKIFQSEANFLLVKNIHQQLFEKLLSKGIIVRNFPELNAIRLTVGQAHENARVLETLKELIH